MRWIPMRLLWLLCVFTSMDEPHVFLVGKCSQTKKHVPSKNSWVNFQCNQNITKQNSPMAG